jgi:acetyl esterase/lipase
MTEITTRKRDRRRNSPCSSSHPGKAARLIAAGVVLEDPNPARQHWFPNGTTGINDVVFATLAGYRPLRLDLYLPPGDTNAAAGHPLLVVIHGGGWQAGHTRHFGAFANWPEALASLAGEGIVVASVEYRLSREAAFPAAFDDVREAIRWLRANAATYGIDSSRVMAFGSSAGGQLAALVGSSCGDLPNSAANSLTGFGTNSGENAATTDNAQATRPAESPCVQGVVAWYGVFDFVPLAESLGPGAAIPDAIEQYLDCATGLCDPAVVRAASPLHWIDSADPPFLLIHGTEDRVVPVQQSRLMDAALKKAGVNSTLIEIPGVQHSFIGATPAATRSASLQAWEATVEFIRKVLRSSQQPPG